MMRYKFLIVAAMILCAAPAIAGFQEGVDALSRGDYSLAYREWLPLAQAGNASAAYNIGYMNEMGYGGRVNYATALSWYKRAAIAGHRGAEFRIGLMYENGRGVVRDLGEARKWYENSAIKGDRLAVARFQAMQTGGPAGASGADRQSDCSGIVVRNSTNSVVRNNRADCIDTEKNDHVDVYDNVGGKYALAAGTTLQASDLVALQMAVHQMCVQPDQTGSYLKIDGDLNVGAILRIVGVNGEGRITKESWQGISQRLDKYKTDPRECAASILPILIQAMTSPSSR